MSAVDLARSQFARTSIYHFLFLPVTIGLALLTAVLQTRWYRTGQPDHLRLTSSRLGPDLLREVAPTPVTATTAGGPRSLLRHWDGRAPRPTAVGTSMSGPLVRFGAWLLAWRAALLIVRLVAAMSPSGVAEKEVAPWHG
jgi:Cytochrome bd terminal oxidase subunit I